MPRPSHRVGPDPGAHTLRAMSILFVVNRSSGVGRAERLTRQFARALDAAGERYEFCDARNGAPNGQTHEQYFRRFDVIAAVGGDGTLHHLLGHACRAGVPVYHIPAGNENLFAREFGMDGDPQRLLRALERARTRAVDVPSLDGRPFAIMVSFGPDAGVIHRLDEVRSRATGHTMYLRPVLKEAFGPRLARVSVRVDGREVVADGRGMLVIANSPQYATNLNPAPHADIADGMLDAVFLPARSTASVLLWGLRCATRDQLHTRGAIAARGERIEVLAHAPTPMQSDGEAAGWLEPGQTASLTVRPGALRVLVAR
jgi:diacylglycerol kinase (ATP)